MNLDDYRNGKLLVAIPFYRNANLVEPLLSSLARCLSELKELNASILCIIDSPEDTELATAIARSIAGLNSDVDVTVHVNEQNIGFVSSVNFAFGQAIKNVQDVVILNSDVEVFAGALTEMRRIAYCDPMIGFVNPRSNNATLATMPHQSGSQHLSAMDAYKSYLKIKPLLKEYTYSPTAVGFAMLIKWKILNEFGIFDPVYGYGYNEENDLVMRANRCGYRAALANKAFVYHIGEKSFSLTDSPRSKREKQNAKILQTRYPEYRKAVASYFGSIDFLTEKLVCDSMPNESGKRSIAFDLTHLGSYYNGTFEAARHIISEMVAAGRGEFEFFAVCGRTPFEFHKLQDIGGLSRIDKASEMPLAAIIRIGQPYEPDSISWLRMRAPVLVVMMLDTISLDCAYLASEPLYELWQKTIDVADIICFNSVYSEQQFKRRFSRLPDTEYLALLHSTDSKEYVGESGRLPVSANDGYVLLAGNEFAHKFLPETVERIEKMGDEKDVVVFGIKQKDRKHIKYVKSSKLMPTEVEALYANASCVVFPSHYEGFGFPIMKALAWSKPVFARDIPAYREIADRSPERSNIHLFESTDRMLDAAFSGAITWKSAVDATSVAYKWRDSGVKLLAAVKDSLRNLDQKSVIEKVRRVNWAQPSNKRKEGILNLSAARDAINQLRVKRRLWQKKA